MVLIAVQHTRFVPNYTLFDFFDPGFDYSLFFKFAQINLKKRRVIKIRVKKVKQVIIWMEGVELLTNVML